jgi:hypothetical protein
LVEVPAQKVLGIPPASKPPSTIRLLHKLFVGVLFLLFPFDAEIEEGIASAETIDGKTRKPLFRLTPFFVGIGEQAFSCGPRTCAKAEKVSINAVHAKILFRRIFLIIWLVFVIS